ncbi:SLAP domain-containing protein [Brevibacillus daliensis]|uniref:SLAP domain-containing protein n=1 Tax=Brevibacillus daliensis TaxID=2892995 RepID=UPI001E4FE596|nr:SLAP domain-containing protein [Brevibacillus daliensis]
MSYKLANLFGSTEGLDQARKDIHDHLQKEVYLGVSGLEQPELSSNRLSSKELEIYENSFWAKELDDVELEFLQMIHDELPSVVRDEIGVFPFFTNVLNDGFLVITFLRNATEKDIILNKLPLALVDAKGNVYARKTFELLAVGPVPKLSSRPLEFKFDWENFIEMPDEDTQLTMVYDNDTVKQFKRDEELVEKHNGLTDEEEETYTQKVEELFPIKKGQVELQAIDLVQVKDGGLKVIVAFMNGLEKRVEFTEVPVIICDEKGRQIANMHFGMQSLQVQPNNRRLWGFYIPVSSIEAKDMDVSKCKAYVPEARQDKDVKRQQERMNDQNGLIQ